MAGYNLAIAGVIFGQWPLKATKNSSHTGPQKFKMATSFKKKSTRGRAIYPPGTRPSLHNNQLLVSSGVPSMDNVIGETH